MTLEVLDRPLVAKRRLARAERPQVPALSGPGIPLSRIQAVLSAAQATDHDVHPLPGAARAPGLALFERQNHFLVGHFTKIQVELGHRGKLLGEVKDATSSA